MNDLILYGIILGVWFTLQLWVFPKLGILTCMSGACGVRSKPKQKSSAVKGKYEGEIDFINGKG